MSHESVLATVNFDEIADSMRRANIQWGHGSPNVHVPDRNEIEAFVRRQLIRFDVVHRDQSYARTHSNFTFERERMDTGGWAYKVTFEYLWRNW